MNVAAFVMLAVAGMQQPAPASFVVLRGTDTVAVETFTRTPTRVKGELRDRIAYMRQIYDATIAPDGTISRLDIEVRAQRSAATAPPMQHVVLTFRGDSVVVQVGANTQTLAVARGALPFVNLSFALTEQIVRRARTLGGGARTLPLFVIAGGQTLSMTATPVGADSVVLSLGGVDLRVHTDAAGRLLGAAVPAQQLTVRRVAAIQLTQATPAPDYAAPAGAPYTAQSVRFVNTSGDTLAGTLTLPKMHSKPVPVVITVSGSGAQNRDATLPGMPDYVPFRQIADTLARRGVAVLRFDDRGFGESGGDFSAATTADFAQDAEAAVRMLRTRSDIDTRRIYLLGHSEGAAVAALAAVHDTAVAGLIFLAGAARPGREILRYQMRYVVENNPNIPPEKRDSAAAAEFGKLEELAPRNAWTQFFMSYDPLATARRLRMPVLILQGERDWQVQPEQAGQLAEAIRANGNHDVTVRTFPERNHLFLEDPTGNPISYTSLTDRRLAPDVLGTVVDWVLGHGR